MTKVLEINNHLDATVREMLQDKMGADYDLTYVEDIPDYAVKDNPTVATAIEESVFLIYVILNGKELPFEKWIIEEAIRLGKRIVAIYISTLDARIPIEIESYADAIVNIDSPGFGTAITGGGVFEQPDMTPRPSRTIKRTEC